MNKGALFPSRPNFQDGTPIETKPPLVELEETHIHLKAAERPDVDRIATSLTDTSDQNKLFR